MVKAMAILLVIISVQTLAQEKNTGVDKAERLRQEGVDHFKKKEYKAAIEKYTAAIETYGSVLGKTNRTFLSEAVVLCRAVVWCRANNGQHEKLEGDVRAFYKIVYQLGGSADEEVSVNNCMIGVLESLGDKKSMKQLEAVFRAYTGVLGEFIRLGKKDRKRKAAMRSFVDRMEVNVGRAMRSRMLLLLLAGEEAKGLRAYARTQKYWRGYRNRIQAAWTAQNAFYEMTVGDFPKLASFFLAETLAAVKKDGLFQVEVRLWCNLRNYLLKLEQEKRWEDGIRFLEKVLPGNKRRNVYTEGLPEEYFRFCLGRFLLYAEAWDKLAKNGDNIVRLGRAEKYGYLEARGASMAGQGCFKAGKVEEAIKRFDISIQRADAAGDAIGAAQGRVRKSRALLHLKRYGEASDEVQKAAAEFKRVGHGIGLTDARKAGLAVARAAGDEALIARYERALRRVSAKGGAAGASIGGMKPGELTDLLHKQKKPTDILEITRSEDRLLFKNLLDGSSVEEPISYSFHHLNVSGILFQIRGPEILLVNIYNHSRAPGTQGEFAANAKGKVSHTGPAFNLFQMRHCVGGGAVLRVSNACLLHRIK